MSEEGSLTEQSRDKTAGVLCRFVYTPNLTNYCFLFSAIESISLFSPQAKNNDLISYSARVCVSTVRGFTDDSKKRPS